MGTKSRDKLYGTSVRVAAERAGEARKTAQPSPTLGDALYTYLEVRCLGCDTHQTVATRHRAEA